MTRDLAEQVLAAARVKGIRIATAESCTGGLVAGALTDIPGSSDVFERGFVTYSNEAKTDLLGVPAHLIRTCGAVSEEVARAMALGALGASSAALALSVTGVAGPGQSEAKPEGMVWFGAAFLGQDTTTQLLNFGAIGRHKVRESSVRASLEQALVLIEKAHI